MRPNSNPVTMVVVIDPSMRVGKQSIPLHKTFPTKGRDEWLACRLQNKDLSLCCLYQHGSCRAESRCFQVHADIPFITTMRAKYATAVSCCVACGDSASAATEFTHFWKSQLIFDTLKVQFETSNKATKDCTEVSVRHVAYTDGLYYHAITRKNPSSSCTTTLTIPSRAMCRLHLMGNCKYGKDCKNVHFCCKLQCQLLMDRSCTALPKVQATFGRNVPEMTVSTTLRSVVLKTEKERDTRRVKETSLCETSGKVEEQVGEDSVDQKGVLSSTIDPCNVSPPSDSRSNRNASSCATTPQSLSTASSTPSSSTINDAHQLNLSSGLIFADWVLENGEDEELSPNSMLRFQRRCNDNRRWSSMYQWASSFSNSPSAAGEFIITLDDDCMNFSSVVASKQEELCVKECHYHVF